MDEAPIITLTNAARAALALATFAMPLNPVRQFLPRVDLKDADTINVLVVPKSVATEILSRNEVLDTLSIDVAIMKRVAAGDDGDAETEGLIALAADVAAWFEFGTLEGFAGAWVGTVVNQIYAPDHLSERQQFTSVITITYRLRRSRRNA